jgi:uncharacterized protein DUF6502
VTTQRAARRALKKILSPLSGFAVDCGLSVSDVNSILRECAVKYVVARQLEEASRVNISGVAAMTGISRAEISRILKMTDTDISQSAARRESPTARVLRAWRQDPRFMTANGAPKALKVYGRGPTFESLVKAYGRGIPIRAFFDELTRVGAIEMRASKEIIPRKSWEISRRNAVRNISAIGCGFNNLISSASKGIRHPDGSGNREGNERVWSGAVPLIKEKSLGQTREIFIEVHNLLMRYKATPNLSRKSPKAATLTVTIVLSEAPDKSMNRSRHGRRNFRRNS